MAARKVAVIGANGFLGAPLVDALLAQGADVHTFDRYSTWPRHLLPKNVTVFQGDLLSRTSLAAAVENVDDVFHFMSLTDPQRSAKDPLHDIATNVTASVELFALCAAAGTQRIFFASSGGTVYGTSAPPHSEACALNPVSPYGIGKASLESYLRFFEVQHGLESVTLRISNPYGPSQKPRSTQGIIPMALRAARDGQQLKQFGDGSMIRDYIYAQDLNQMLLEIWHRPMSRTYNLASGVGTTLTGVFDVVEQVTGARLDLEQVSTPPSFVHTSVLDTGRYITQFGEPKLTPLREGVEATWERIRQE